VSRDYDPEPGQWYEDLDRGVTFQVVSVDPDEELVRIQSPEREIQEIDLDAWQELDLDLADEPEGWVDEDEDDEDDEEDDEDEDEDWDEEDDDWDDEDEDEDDDYDDNDDEYRDRE
jgi:hypothetical protein